MTTTCGLQTCCFRLPCDVDNRSMFYDVPVYKTPWIIMSVRQTFQTKEIWIKFRDLEKIFAWLGKWDKCYWRQDEETCVTMKKWKEKSWDHRLTNNTSSNILTHSCNILIFIRASQERTLVSSAPRVHSSAHLFSFHCACPLRALHMTYFLLKTQ